MFPKPIICFLAFVSFFSIGFGQKNQEKKIWNLLLENNRKEALNQLKKIEKTTPSALITDALVNNENGIFTANDELYRVIKTMEGHENYVYAFWNNPMFFQEYLTLGFQQEIIDRVESFDPMAYQNLTFRDAIRYLQAITSREQKDWDGYFEKVSLIPSLREWEFCGPFENLNQSGLTVSYPPKTTISSNGFDANSFGSVNWYDNEGSQRESYQFLLNHSEYGSGVNYAQTFIYNNQARRVRFFIGASEDFKLFVNDQEILSVEDNNYNDVDAHGVEISLPEGINRILIKLSDSGGTPYFILRLMDQNNQIIEDITHVEKTQEYQKNANVDLGVKAVSHIIESFFEQKIKEDSEDIVSQLALVHTYLRNSKYKPSLKILNQLKLKYPNSTFLEVLLSTCYTLEGDAKKSEEIKDNIIKDHKDYYLSHVYRMQEANTIFKLPLEEFNEYLEDLRNATDMPMILSTVEFFRASRAMDKKEIELQMEAFLQDPKNYRSLKSKYASLYTSALGKPEKYQEFLEGVFDSSFDYNYLTSLARIYNRNGEKEKVEEIFESQKPYLLNDNIFLCDYFDYLYDYEKYDEGIAIMQKALENFPNSAKALKRLGDAHFQKGDKNKAMTFYKKYLTYRGSNSGVRKKVEDYEKTAEILNEYSTDEVYDFIAEERGKERNNNYGYNFLLDEIVVRLFPEGGGKSVSKYCIEITNQNGVESFKEYNLGLSGSYKFLKSEIVKQDKSIKPASRSGSSLVFNDLEIGDVINVEYERNWSSRGRFFKDFMDWFQVDYYHPTVKQNYTIITPEDFDLHYQVINGEHPVEIENKSNYKVYQWVAENLAPLETEEDLMPSIYDVARVIHLSSIDSWDDIALWYRDLVTTQLEINEEVEKAFSEIFPKPIDNYSDEEKARNIYNYLSKNISYSFVEFKQSGYVPQRPSRTLTSKLGDCKDLSTLFVVLGDMAGLRSHLVLVLTSDYGTESMKLPNKDFNHCIVAVEIGGKKKYLELTDNSLPFMSKIASLENATFLEIPNKNYKEVRSGIFTNSEYEGLPSVLETLVDIKVSEEQQTLMVKSNMTGSIASGYIKHFKENEGKLLNEGIEGDFQSRTDATIVLENLNSTQTDYNKDSFTFDAELKIEEKLNQIGSMRLLSIPYLSHPYNTSLTNEEVRNYPIEYVIYENVDEYKSEYLLEIQEDEVFVEIPNEKKGSFKNHRYSIEYIKLTDNKLKIILNAHTPKDRISAEEYPAFREYVRSFISARKEMLGIKKII